MTIKKAGVKSCFFAHKDQHIPKSLYLVNVCFDLEYVLINKLISKI